MTFRGHFILRIFGEVGWVVLLLIFIEVIFSKTSNVRGWSEDQYLFLMGTHMLVTSLFEAFFFENCWRISDLVRTGNLDFVLVKPANPQFLLTFERIDFAALANVPVGSALCLYAVMQGGYTITLAHLSLYIVLIFTGVVMLYAMLFMFAITSVWLIRQTGLDALWFYAMSLSRYPSEIYRNFAGGTLWFVCVFVVPVLMVANLPANVMVRTFTTPLIINFMASAIGLLILSSVAFKFALRSYRSASS